MTDLQIAELVRETARQTAIQVVTMFQIKAEQGKPYLKKSECYKLASVVHVDRAIKTGKLKVTVKGRNVLIKREDFNNWLNLNEYLL